MDEYTSYVYKKETLYIDRFLILDRVPINKDSFDLFNTELSGDIKSKLLNIKTNGYKGFEKFNKTNNYYLCDFSVFKDSEKVFLYTQITSEKNEKVVIDVDLPGYSKLWVNNKLVMICHERQNREHIVVNLDNNNSLIIEYYLKDKDTFPPFALIQVYSYKQIVNNQLLPRMKERMLSEKLQVVPYYNSNNCELKFMFIPLNSTRSTIVGFHNLQHKDKLIKEEFKVFRVYSYKISDIKDSISKYYMISDIFPYKHNFLISISEPISEQIISKAVSVIKADETDKANVFGMINKYENPLTFDQDKYSIIAKLNKFINGKILNNSYDGTSKIYYLSSIDNSYQEIIIKFPKDYNDKKDYPLIACLGISEFDYYLFCEEENNEYIIVNISGRGVMGGSYISEACYLEAIRYMINNYSINENKIYLLGKSNGGYASWSIMQNYPDLAAAAFPISGYPYYKHIKNVTNIPIINYVSTLDSCYYNNENSINEILKSYSNYSQINIKNMVHHAISEYFHFSILEFFRGKKRNNYPDNIYFRTERNRYLKSYWLKLYGISFGKKYALITASILSSSFIEITVKNTDGFAITIPPQIDKRNFKVIVNTKVIHFYNYNKNKIIFELKEGLYNITNDDSRFNVDTIKGMGLLDVYMDNMRIIVPDELDNAVKRVADNFSTPSSNGYYNKISVNYPIYKLNQIRETVLHNNLIFIGVKNPEKLFDGNIEIPIKTYNDYFEYKKNKYYGDYVILYIIKNPANEHFSVMFIKANNIKMLRKNMFTRKVVLPFSYLGIHEYWNNVALIFHNNVYYSIYEWGSDLEKIV